MRQSEWRARRTPEQKAARREYMLRYYEDPRRRFKNRVRLMMSTRRGRGKPEGREVSDALLDHLWALLQAGRCAYCGTECDRLEIEHIDTVGPTTIENTTVACRRCNARKHDGLPEEIDLPRRLKTRVRAE
jgi:5-methylcytosine-specific restriction endonuclease McrA